MSEHRARIIASQWLVHMAELELVEALTAEALRTLARARSSNARVSTAKGES